MSTRNRLSAVPTPLWRMAPIVCLSGILAAPVQATGVLPAPTPCMESPGDVDANGVTNIVDVQCLILAVLMAPSMPACIGVPTAMVDLNCDGQVAVSDLVLAITWTLGSSLSPLVDADGSNCPDTCEVAKTAEIRRLWAATPSVSASFQLVPRGGLAPIVASQSPSFRLAPAPAQ